MTNRTQEESTSLTNFRQRLAAGRGLATALLAAASRLGDWSGWFSLLLLFLTLEIAAYSLERARWISPQPPLTIILVLAMLAGFVLHRVRLPGAAKHAIATVLGAAVMFWQSASFAGIGVGRVIETLGRSSLTISNQDQLPFVLFLVFLVWIAGYVSTWFVLQRRNPWVAIVLGAATLLVNLNNLSREYYFLFFLFLVIAILLIGQMALARRHYQLKNLGLEYPGRATIIFLSSVLCLSLIAVSLAWLTPAIKGTRVETLVSASLPGKSDIEEFLNYFVASVPAKQLSLKNTSKPLAFDEPFAEGNEPRFTITSEQPFYWRTRSYDIYTSSGWASSKTASSFFWQDISPGEPDEDDEQRKEVTYTVTPRVKTDVVLTAGGFISANTPTFVHSLVPRSFDVDLLQPTTDPTLPPDVASLARGLRTLETAGLGLSLSELKQFLIVDLVPTTASAHYEGTAGDIQPSAITLTRQSSSDTVTVSTTRLLEAGDRYSVTTSVSTATPLQLSSAGTDYPHWVTDYYLQLPATLPERVRVLAENITRGTVSPYEKIEALEQYFFRYQYTLESKASPKGTDAVDYFLFTQKSGNCTYFASAMTVMLRSVGVPARLAAGYMPGEWNPDTGVATIRARQYHAWTEVYFPGYGWVDFETVPATGGSTTGTTSEAGTDTIVPAGAEDWEQWAIYENMWHEQDEMIVSDQAAPIQMPRQSIHVAPIVWALLGLGLLALALRFAFQRWLGQFEHRGVAADIYGRLCLLASLHRIRPQPQQTPGEFCTSMALAFPTQAEAIRAIGELYVEAQFSRRKLLPFPERLRLEMQWRQVYPALLRRLLRLKGTAGETNIP